ncbi:MAG: TRAP transporter large permease subunit, partial [Pseudomonadota bacterium]
LTARERWQCLVFVIPLGVLSTSLFVQPSVPKAGFYGFLAALGSALVLFPDFRSGARLRAALVDAGRMSAAIVVIVAAIGLIVGLIQISGFAGRLSLLLAQLASGPLFLVLLTVALGSIVLGMGLPPGATYFVIVIALSSGIEAVGIPELTLHLFVVFFAVMSTVTPPVALAAFAAAPIAGADPIRTGFAAARIGIAGFLVPFVFAWHPALLYKLQVLFPLLGGELSRSSAVIDPGSIPWVDFVWILFAFTLALWLLASALAGFERGPLAPLERVARAALALLMLAPAYLVALPAAAAGAALIAIHRSRALAPAARPSQPQEET